MGVDDIVNQQMASVTSAQRGQQRQRRQNAGNQPAANGGTVQIDLGAVSQMEKTDLMFWMMVLDSFLLLVIALKL